MNDSSKNKLAVLQDLATEIIVSGRPRSTLRAEVLSLKSLLTDAGLYRFDPDADLAHGETPTPSGVAVSPAMAAMCMDDYARTTEFLRGLYAAITALRKRISDRPVSVLYAGCGPFAALVVPVMAVLKPEDATFTLIEIHPESIASARSVVNAFGFNSRVKAFEMADAAEYKVPADDVPDIVLSETLRATLTAEPQVAITRNLIAQAPDALLIPEEIRVELKLVDRAREFAFNGAMLERDRINVGSALVLDRDSVIGWRDVEGDHLDGATLCLPDSFSPKYAARLFTAIRVFADHGLEDHASGLTCPIPLGQKYEPKPGDELRFWYELGPEPGLGFEVKSRSRGVNVTSPR